MQQGRLLHYFPPTPSKLEGQQEAADVSTSLTNDMQLSAGPLSSNKENDSSKHNTQKEEDWCGWHTDHGSLTGLTSAMYMRGDEVVPSPDPQAGLYIRARQGGEVTQVQIPSDHIAFQMGEAMQVCIAVTGVSFFQRCRHCILLLSVSLLLYLPNTQLWLCSQLAIAIIYSALSCHCDMAQSGIISLLKDGNASQALTRTDCLGIVQRPTP